MSEDVSLPPTPPLPAAVPSWRAVRAKTPIVLLALLQWIACFYLYTHHNDFPYLWHPDEGYKADQVLTGRRNHNHPLLMLETTLLAHQLLGTPSEVQPTVELGRDVSAAFAATAVAALALAAYGYSGMAGMFLVGLTVGLCPSLLLYAHYMKEEPALIVGLALVTLAAQCCWKARHRYWRGLSWLFLGAACAIATSGKYVGAMSILAALPVILLARPFRWFFPLLRLLAFSPALLGVMAAINYQAIAWDVVGSIVRHGSLPAEFSSFLKPQFRAGLEKEALHGVTGHSGLTLAQPNTFVLQSTLQECQPHILVLAALFVALSLWTWRRRQAWELWLIWYLAVCLSVLSLGRIPFSRYALPVVVLAHLMAGLALAWLLQRLAVPPDSPSPSTAGENRSASSRLRWSCAVALALIAGVILALQLPRSLDYLAQFGDDSRLRLRAWAATNLPPRARVLQDSYAALGGATLRTRRPTVDDRPDLVIYQRVFAPDYASLESLKRSDVKWVIVCDIAYSRFFEPLVQPLPGTEASYRQRREWYERLFREGTLVWSAEATHPLRALTNPTIKVYRLD